MLACIAGCLFQSIAWLRTLARIVRVSEIAPIEPVEASAAADITIVVPVLDEAARIGPLLECLMDANSDVAEIFVVDGGSRDATCEIVTRYATREPRLRLIRAEQQPIDWNGKAWNMHCGLAEVRTPYVLYLDADVVIAKSTPSSLRRTLLVERLGALSVAASQRCHGFFSTALHAALLTTFAYRHGRPGQRARTVGEATANGQVFFAECAALRATHAIAQAKDVRCDDLRIVEN